MLLSVHEKLDIEYGEGYLKIFLSKTLLKKLHFCVNLT